MSDKEVVKPPLVKPPEQVSRQSQLFFAAVMASLHDNCNCRACNILKKIADTMINNLVGGALSGEGGGKT